MKYRNYVVMTTEEYKKLETKLVNVAGFHKKIESYELLLNRLQEQIRLLTNHVKALEMRHNKLRQRFRNNQIK